MAIDDYLNSPNTGIIIVDMQKYFVDQLPNFKSLINKQINILKFHPKIFIVNLEFKPSRYGYTLPLIKNEINNNNRSFKTIKKNYMNGFKRTKLNKILKEYEIHNILIMGCNTSFCVFSTAKSASNLGYTLATSKNLVSQSGYTSSQKYDFLEEAVNWYKKNTILF